MRIRTVRQRRTASAHPYAAGHAVPARGIGANAGGGPPLRIFAGRTALRIPRRNRAARPHAGLLPAPGNAGGRGPSLTRRRPGPGGRTAG
ncbi:hypothetical protein G6F57_023768 [Rhizopus arrhizus]|nr:hypothetical protein G6F57_023768 [Rhizopus arrhizus]